jgi:hypothetical protein
VEHISRPYSLDARISRHSAIGKSKDFLGLLDAAQMVETE